MSEGLVLARLTESGELPFLKAFFVPEVLSGDVDQPIVAQWALASMPSGRASGHHQFLRLVEGWLFHFGSTGSLAVA